MEKTGIDISVHNGDVNIAALKGQIDFVIIRCGYGGDYTNQDDTQYWSNIKKCESAGIPYGVYLYSYATNSTMAASEAAHTLRLLKGTTPLYGVWYDLEDATLPTGDTLINDCILYCDTIEKAGYYCGIYSSTSFLNSNLNSTRLDPYDKWVAQWSNSVTYPKPYGIWQYTDSGVLNGQVFDMNKAYKDYPSIIGGEEEEAPEELTKDEIVQIAQQEAKKIYDKNNNKYPTINSTPAWVKDDIKKVYQILGLTGSGKKGDDIVIDASEDYLRMNLIISKLMDKLGIK